MSGKSHSWGFVIVFVTTGIMLLLMQVWSWFHHATCVDMYNGTCVALFLRVCCMSARENAR